jgi:hypothetical protein
MGSARAERARVAGKTSVTLLSVHKAAARLGARGDALREYTLEKATLLYELDEHGRVSMLAGASSNVRNPAHNACRTPQDSALIEDLRRHRIPGLVGSSKSTEDTKQDPERPEEPLGSPETPSKPSLMARFLMAKSRPLARRTPNVLRPFASTQAKASRAVNPMSARYTPLKLRSWSSVM